MKTLVALLIFLLSGACAARDQNAPRKIQSEPASGLTLACNDAKSITESLHIQRFPLDNESKSRLLAAMGIKIHQTHYFELMYARRISGDCVNQLSGSNGSIFHFYTGVNLVLAGEGDGVFFPYPGRYLNQVIFDSNRSRPGKMPQQFARAIGVSSNARSSNIELITDFIGIREQDGKSHFTYYEKLSSGGFHVDDEIFEVGNKIKSIRFIMGTHGTGSMQLLLPDENSIVLLSFLWVHKNLIKSATNTSYMQKYEAPVPILETTDSICLDAEILSRSIRFQTSERRENESGIELLDSLGIEIMSNQGIRFESISHIDGECLEHLEDASHSLLYFDTGVILERNKSGMIVPSLKLRDPNESWRHVISQDDPHPKRDSYHFIEAIATGWGHFIGIWEKDDRFILSLYRTGTADAGKVYARHNLISFKNKIINIKISPHNHNPSGILWLLLKDEESLVLLTFLVRIPWLE